MKKTTFIFWVLLVSILPFYGQTVSTFTDGTPDDAIAIDSNGNIYCSNYVGDKVFKFTPTGEMTEFVTGLNTPNGLAFNSNDELYICDGQGNTIYKYDINGNLLNSYPVSGHPSGIVKSFTDETMIYTEYQGNTINRLALDGSISEISNALGLNGPVGIVYDSEGTLFVGNYTDREIYRVFENGDIEYVAKVPTDGGAMPNLGFISFGQGYLWGTTMGSDKIYKINPNGIDDYELFAGSTPGSQDGNLNNATFHTPNGIAFSENEETMFITDFGSKNLRIISGVLLENPDIELKKKEIVLYPNPAINEVNISANLSDGNNYKINVYNVLGKTVYQYNGESNGNLVSNTINIESWDKGLYFIQLTVGKTTITEKLVK